MPKKDLRILTRRQKDGTCSHSTTIKGKKQQRRRLFMSLTVIFYLSIQTIINDKRYLIRFYSTPLLLLQQPSQNEMSVSTTTMNTAKDYNIDNNSSSFCFTPQGSKNQIALEMANYSTPIHSTSYHKIKHILKKVSYFYVDPKAQKDSIFHHVFQHNIIPMLQGYGLQQQQQQQQQSISTSTNTNANTTLFVEISFHGYQLFKQNHNNHNNNNNNSNIPRMILQTEQLIKQGYRYLSYLKTCHESPMCFIIDFSDNHYRWAKGYRIQDSFLLLPFLHQTRLGTDYHNYLNNSDKADPSVSLSSFQPLSNRSLDITFFGLLLRRRLQIQYDFQQASKAAITAAARATNNNNNTWNIRIEKNMDIDYIKKSYANSKICPIIHSFHEQSAGEYHRLSELGPSGCIPIMENIMDIVSINIYKQCGGVIFVSYQDMVNTTISILQTIQNHHNNHNNNDISIYERKTAERIRWWNQKIYWSKILSIIFDNDYIIPDKDNDDDDDDDEEEDEQTNSMNFPRSWGERISNLPKFVSSIMLPDRKKISAFPIPQADNKINAPNQNDGSQAIKLHDTPQNDTTIIVVSSFIPTHPHFNMINATIHSVYTHLHGLFPTAPLIIACDGPPNLQWKKKRYNAYIANLRSTFTLPHQKIIVADTNVGLTGNIKNAMDIVETEFVYVIQHDMPFIRQVEHGKIIQIMHEYPNVLPLVRFNLYDNIPQTNKEQNNSFFKSHYNADTSVNKNVYGIQFTKTALWSDNNHLTRKSYYEKLWPLFATKGGFTGWKRPPEAIMMRGDIVLKDAPNCTRWCTHLYGSYGDKPYIGHFDGRTSFSLIEYEEVIFGNATPF